MSVPPLAATLSDETAGVVPPNACTLIGPSSAAGTLRTKRIAPGPGIGVTFTDNTLTITNTEASGASVTLEHQGAAGTVSLVTDGVGPSLALCGTGPPRGRPRRASGSGWPPEAGSPSPATT